MIYRFGEYELDTAAVELRAGGVVCALEPQVFALIAYLIEHRERMVSKDEIVEKVWDGRDVSDSTLMSRVKSARRVVGDDGKTQRCIRTIHSRGWRFVAPVQIGGGPVVANSSTDAAAAQRSTRPALAVFAFRTQGGGERYAALGGALADELITELSRLRWLLVTARGSSFRFNADEVDFVQVGRLLGVRYCLKGTLELSAKRSAITVELIDTHDANVVWGDRLSGGIDDLHALREDLSRRVLTALDIRIPLHEAFIRFDE